MNAITFGDPSSDTLCTAWGLLGSDEDILKRKCSTGSIIQNKDTKQVQPGSGVSWSSVNWWMKQWRKK